MTKSAPQSQLGDRPKKQMYDRDDFYDYIDRLDEKTSSDHFHDAVQVVKEARFQLSIDLGVITQRIDEEERFLQSPNIRFDSRVNRALENIDPVIAYCIRHQFKDLDGRDELITRAVAAYAQNQYGYDSVLSKFIPQALLDQAAPFIARRNYRFGINVTALEDWSVFMQDDETAGLGLSTGIKFVDEGLGGGLRGITAIAGDQGSGKTSLALAMIIGLLRKHSDLGCLYFSLDQPKGATYGRLRSIASGIPHMDWLRATADPTSEQAHMNAAADADLRDNLLGRIGMITVKDLPESASEVAGLLRQKHNEFIRATKAKGIVLVMDMFQSLSQSVLASTPNETDEQCAELIKDFTHWAESRHSPEGPPVILTSEVRKDVKELTNDDVRGSSRLVSIANNILLLNITPGAQQTGENVRRTLVVGKSRYGNAGSRYELDFQHGIGHFSLSRVRRRPKQR